MESRSIQITNTEFREMRQEFDAQPINPLAKIDIRTIGMRYSASHSTLREPFRGNLADRIKIIVADDFGHLSGQ